MQQYLAFATIVLLSLQACIETPNEFEAIPPGPWRATLDLSGRTGGDENAFDERTKGQLPFNFEVTYVTRDSFVIDILNGEERIRLDRINFGLDRRTGKDTIRIHFPAFGSYIYAQYEEDAIEGNFYEPSRGENYSIPFKALHGKTDRFSSIEVPVEDISGDWACRFEIATDDPYPAIGSFTQQESGRVTGTFRTETGDYRFLEGKMANNRLYLSVFDGAHAFLFEAKLLEDGSMTGIFRSGNHYKSYWEARRDTTIELADPFSLTQVRDDYENLSFAFPNSQGDTVTLNDARYQDKPKLIQILGTWCPNCRDETEFLLSYRKEHPELEFEVIGLAFERGNDAETARRAINRYREFFGIDYEILHAGSSSKAVASQQLPMLTDIVSYPTLLFVDRQDRIRHIHTGFNGPATDQWDQFKVDFERDLREIIESEPAQ